MESFTLEDAMEVREFPQNPDSVEGALLEPQLVDTPEAGEVLVSGDPFGVGEYLDDHQGDNAYNFGGCCGLVTVSNLLTMAGLESTEDEVIGRAISLNLCQYDVFGDPNQNGGTNVYQRQLLLQSYGISSTVFSSKEQGGGLEAIADYVEAGHGVNISVNAGYAWDDPNAIGDGTSNHSIVVTGTVWDPETGALKGLYVCDSGLTDRESSAMFLSVEVLQDAYLDAGGTSALVTDNPIR